MPAITAWPEFNPFVRTPMSALGVVKAVLCGIVLVPVRVVGTLLTLILLWVWTSLAIMGADNSKPYPPNRRRLVAMPIRMFARLLLFWQGFLWISETYREGCSLTAATGGGGGKKGKGGGKAAAHPAAVVCNHVGFSEILYLTARYGCCYVSKAAVAKLPFIGPVATACQTIFVDREHSSATGDSSTGGHTSDLIRARMNAEPGTWPPLAMFPEGTTTNGKTLIHFRTGAFLAGRPLQPVAVTLRWNPAHAYDPHFTCWDTYRHMIGLMSQPINFLDAVHMPVYTPSEGERADPHLFADNMRKQIAAETGLPCYELEWMHKLPYELKLSQRTIGWRMLRAANGGKDPPIPVFTIDERGNKVTPEAAAAKAKAEDELRKRVLADDQ